MQPRGGEDMGLQQIENRAHSTAARAPTWSASVDRLSGTPSLA
jgi:hypothetical protein